MTKHEQNTTSVTVRLTESEIQNAIDLGIRAALEKASQPHLLTIAPSKLGKGTAHFFNQWRGQAKW